jgi:predicted DNA-binding transcriptional regulator YafY
MDRTERFYKIEQLIRFRGCVDRDTLLAELGVSLATLKRDLEYLRDRMDAPIVWDAFDRGYKLAPRSGDSAHAQHELPGVWFSEREIHALLTMHQLIQGLDEGGVLARHLQPLLDKLHGMLGEDPRAAQALLKRVRIVSTAKRPVASQWFELFGDALVRRMQVRMQYRTRGREATTWRVVSAQRLTHYRSTWYLDAWCHTKQQLLRFALDAVQQAEVLNQRARELPLKKVEEALDAGYGIFAGSKPQWAQLVFSATAARWVSQEQWHPQQRGRWLSDGTYQLEVPYTNQTELVMDLLRHSGEVKVMSPPSLAQAVVAQLRLGLKAQR